MIMGGGTQEFRPTQVSALPLAEVIERYKAALAGWATPVTLEKAGWFLDKLADRLGRLPLVAITPADIKTAVEAKKDWGPTTKNEAYARLSALYRWAIKAGLCKENPVAMCPRPVRLSRAAASAPSPEDAARILSVVGPSFRIVLEAMYDTDCRPSDVIRVTAAEFDRTHKVWRLAAHKTARKTGRPHQVLLTDRVAATCERLAREHPTGPLYRTQTGRPIKHPEWIAKAVREARRKLGLPEEVVPYGFRHAFATDSLVRGVSDVVVAALLGHTTPTVVNRNYGHVSERGRELRAALDQVRGSAQ
jgi:integrase